MQCSNRCGSVYILKHFTFCHRNPFDRVVENVLCLAVTRCCSKDCTQTPWKIRHTAVCMRFYANITIYCRFGICIHNGILCFGIWIEIREWERKKGIRLRPHHRRYEHIQFELSWFPISMPLRYRIQYSVRILCGISTLHLRLFYVLWTKSISYAADIRMDSANQKEKVKVKVETERVFRKCDVIVSVKMQISWLKNSSLNTLRKRKKNRWFCCSLGHFVNYSMKPHTKKKINETFANNPFNEVVPRVKCLA